MNQQFNWGDVEDTDDQVSSSQEPSTFDWGDGYQFTIAPDHQASEPPKTLFQRADEAIYSALGDRSPFEAARDLINIPVQMYQGLEHGASSVNTQIAGLEATLREIPGTKTDEQRELERQNIANQSRYRSQREKSMGTVGQLTSLATQIAPHVLTSPIVGPAGAFAMGTGTTMGDIGARQIEKYGEVDPSSVMQAGVTSGLIDLGLSAATHGIAPKIASEMGKFGTRVGESFLSGAQQSMLSDVGAGDEVGLEKAFEAGLMGGTIRSGFEGANFKLQPEGLQGADTARKVLRDVGVSDDYSNVFAQNVGRGRNTLKNYEDTFMNSSLEDGQKVYAEMSDYLANTPEGQDAVTAAVMQSLQKDLKDHVTLSNFNYDTNDGRNVGKSLGLSEQAMDNSLETVRDVREPLFKKVETAKKGETTQADLGKFRTAFDNSLRNDFKAHVDNISVINKKLDELTELGQKNRNDDINIQRLNQLKTTLNALNTYTRDVMKPGIGAEHADAIPVYSAKAMRLAAETGLLQSGALRGMTDAGFNPTMDFHYMQGKIKSGLARDKQVIEGSKDIYQQMSPEVSPFEKLSSQAYGQAQSMLGGRRISKEREKGAIVLDKYADLLSRPEGPRPEPTPDDVVKAAVDTGDMNLASRVAEDALAEDGLTPMRPPVEDVETANARVDDIVATPEERAAQADTEAPVDTSPERSAPLSPSNLRAADAAVHPEPEVTPEATHVPEEQIQDPREFIDLTGRPTTPEPEVTPTPDQAPIKPLDQMDEAELRQFIADARARLGEESEAPVIKVDEESVREAKGEPTLAQRPTVEESEVTPIEPEVAQPRVSPEDSVRAPEKPSKPVEEEVKAGPQPKVEEPVETPVEAPKEGPKAKKKPDLATTPKKEEPVVEESKAEPVKEEAPKKKPDLAEKPEEVKPKDEPEEEVKPPKEEEESAAEGVKEEEVKAEKEEPTPAEEPKPKSERLPTSVSDVTKALEREATRLENLPIKKLLGEEHAHAKALKDASEHIKRQTDSLIARAALTETEGASLADELIQSLGGMDGIKNLKTFKQEFSLSRLELLRNKRRAAAEKRAQDRIDKATETEKRHQETVEKRRAERDAYQEKLSRESHDTINRYAKEEGFTKDELFTAMKKHGYTSSDVVNPVKIRAELERMRREKFEKDRKELEAEQAKTKNDQEIAQQKQDLEVKIDETSQQLKELNQAIDGLRGKDRSNAVRRRQSLTDRLIALNRAKEDVGEMGTSAAIQRKLDSVNDKIRASERSLADIEDQLSHIERAMNDVKGVTKEDVSDYLAQFDIRTLPLEKIDHARNRAIIFVERRVAERKAAADQLVKDEVESLDKGAKESLDAVKDSEDSADILGTFDYIEKTLSKILSKPKENANYLGMAKILERMSNTAKKSQAMNQASVDMWARYFEVMEEALKRRSKGVPDRYLVTDNELNSIRDLYQKSRGRFDHSSKDSGQMWTRLKATLTGNSKFNFESLKPEEHAKLVQDYERGVLSDNKPKKRTRSARLYRGDVGDLKGLF